MRRMIGSLAVCTLLSAATYAGDSDSSAPVAQDALSAEGVHVALQK
jgi:hypothetical protein